MSRAPCRHCGNEIDARMQKCPHCGVPRPVASSTTGPGSSGAGSRMRKGTVAMLASVAMVTVCTVAYVADEEGRARIATGQEIAASCARPDIPAPNYTAEEYAWYREVVDGTAPESTIKEDIARRTGRSRAEIDSVLKRVEYEIFFGEAKPTRPIIEEQARCALGSRVRVRDVIMTGDFANVSYVDPTPARDDDQIREKLVPRMAPVLQALFEIPSVQEAQLTLFYPATDGGELKVASVKVRRQEFDPSVPVTRYTGFSFVGRIRQ